MSLFFLLEETHQATLMRRAGSDTSTNTRSSKSSVIKENRRYHHFGHTLRRSIRIPFLIAGHLPALAILVLISIFNGLVNMILSSLGSVFQSNYAFSPTTTGISYLGLGLGGTVGLAITPRISDYCGKRRSHPNGSKRPQHALPMMMIAGPLASIGLLWHGWSCEMHTHWIVPILGLWVFGLGYTSMQVSSTSEWLLHREYRDVNAH